MYGQNGEKVYRFLSLPTSTHINALGGNNVSLVDNDLSLVFHNPASLGEEMNMFLNVNYMAYVDDIGVGSAIFAKSLSPISTMAFGVSYINYGDFKRYNAEQISEGDFSATDMLVSGVYSRDLTPMLRGGVTAKFIYSSYDKYSSTAVAFDVGLSYYKKEKDLSAGIVLKNIGAQLSSFNEDRVGLPWDVQVGFTKKIAHAPIRLSVTGMYLTQWKFEKIDEANGIESKDDNFFKTLFKHTVIGVDLLPSQNMWIGVGYSPKINSDLKITEGNKWGGWNLGAGLKVSKFNLGFSLSQYSPSATSYHFSFSTDLSKF
ncbi:DUF3308 domain-containing protein [Dysgonomonas sp. 216]|nr:DUF3308 domain-containing protein [Dysgonomonas sp. 216]